MATTKKLTGGIPIADSSGAVSVMTVAQLAAQIGPLLGIPSGATVMKKVILPDEDVDFDDLTDDMTVYSFKSDIPKDVILTNCPDNSHTGGLSVLCIKEGAYPRQIAMFYNKPHMYVRTKAYFSSGTVWTAWKRIAAAEWGG